MKDTSYRANIAYTSLRASIGNDWYFDSGCSRHMIGVRAFLSNIKPYSNCHVTFGDGVKTKIIGKGHLNYPGLSCLTEALLVEGLTANLISISQLCDLNLHVNFTRDKCVVINEEHDELMKGTRFQDNCYMWSPVKDSQVTKCLLSNVDEVELWHQKLGHLNLKSMHKIVSEKATVGLPELKIVEGKICGDCQIGKQVKKSHKMVQHLTTSRVLELLHMDLMGHMQVESLGGKRYVFVCVDDFSRYT